MESRNIIVKISSSFEPDLKAIHGRAISTGKCYATCVEGKWLLMFKQSNWKKLFLNLLSI